MLNGLEKILKLAKKTGDSVIVFNPAKPQDSFVILAINKYEELLDIQENDHFLTDGWELDKIKSDFSSDDDWEEVGEDETEESWRQPEIPLVNWEEGLEKEVKQDLEKDWEEDVNYLYPTEESTPAPEAGFNSIADILKTKQAENQEWTIPGTDAEPIEAALDGLNQ